MKERQRRPGQRRTGFAIAAIGAGLLPFVLLESVLWLTGVGVVSSHQDPFVGFSQIYPLFELDTDKHEYRTARHHHYFFGMQSFPAKKDSGTFRAFCLGGSTVLGHPYETQTAIPKWMEVELSARDASHHYEIINCGGMSYASYRLIPILEEVLSYEPDLIVVMTGQNEFLEDRTYGDIKDRPPARAWVEDRLYSLRMVTLGRRIWSSLTTQSSAPQSLATEKTILEHRVDARLDHSSGYASYHRDEVWSRGVARHFALNLRVMVRLCQRADIPLVLVKPGANLRDCPPFKSEHASQLSVDQRDRWEKDFARASALEPDDPATALDAYSQAALIDDRHAELVYRMARCLDRLERFEEARSLYIQARELDVCPLRIRTEMQKSVLQVANSTSTPVVDAQRLLENQTAHGIAGFDWYVDQVHPSIRGQQLIAEAIVEQLQQHGLIELPPQPWSAPQRRTAYRDHLKTLGDEYFAAGRRRVEWLEDWARRDRLRYDIIGSDIRANLDLGHTCIEFGEFARANAPYRVALDQDPASAQLILNRALQLFESGRTSSAAKMLQILLALKPEELHARRARAALSVLADDLGQNSVADQSDGDPGFGEFISQWLDQVTVGTQKSA